MAPQGLPHLPDVGRRRHLRRRICRVARKGKRGCRIPAEGGWRRSVGPGGGGCSCRSGSGSATRPACPRRSRDAGSGRRPSSSPRRPGAADGVCVVRRRRPHRTRGTVVPGRQSDHHRPGERYGGGTRPRSADERLGGGAVPRFPQASRTGGARERQGAKHVARVPYPHFAAAGTDARVGECAPYGRWNMMVPPTAASPVRRGDRLRATRVRGCGPQCGRISGMSQNPRRRPGIPRQNPLRSGRRPRRPRISRSPRPRRTKAGAGFRLRSRAPHRPPSSPPVRSRPRCRWGRRWPRCPV